MTNNSQTTSVCDHVLIAIRRIIQSIDLHSKSLVKQFGLTGPQLIILKEISQSSEITASDLSRAISLSQATVTGIIDRLEKKGLISRRQSARDRRRTLIETTSSGDFLLETAPPLMQESFIQQFSEMQSWEQHMILSSLNRLVDMMGAKQILAAPMLTTGPIEPAQSSTHNSFTKSQR
ncbi:MAG: MarR family transcriptional regulator [Desulfobacterales bacterium]|nr:MarR family transcriptional regulator [Desulfobacterales bacterium]